MTEANMTTLQAQARSASGKGAARRLRSTGLVPSIAYGKGLPSTAIAVGPKEVASILRSELGKNTVIELKLADKSLVAMIRDFALHPISRQLLHVDFVEVKLDKPVDVEVPLFPTGKPVGVAKGGVLRVVHRLVPVRCLPTQIPLKLTADVTNLELGQHIATQDLLLPPGVSVLLAATQTLIAVVAPEKEVEEAVTPAAAAAAAAAAGAPAAGAATAGAPAADAKKDDKKDDKKK
jgi:large subunit ribosomal protein L25